MWLSKKHWVSIALAVGAAASAVSGHEAGPFLLAIILIELFA